MAPVQEFSWTSLGVCATSLFDNRPCDECLNTTEFRSIGHARVVLFVALAVPIILSCSWESWTAFGANAIFQTTAGGWVSSGENYGCWNCRELDLED